MSAVQSSLSAWDMVLTVKHLIWDVVVGTGRADVGTAHRFLLPGQPEIFLRAESSQD